MAAGAVVSAATPFQAEADARASDPLHSMSTQTVSLTGDWLSDFPGHAGSVIGLDMTDEQLQVARKHVQDYTELLGYSRPNMQFVKGYIENLAEAGIQDESVDMIISNCVVNLSPDKASVIREVYRALAKGGEFYFSDMYCDRRLPKAVKQNEVCTLPVACLQLLIGYLCWIVRLLDWHYEKSDCQQNVWLQHMFDAHALKYVCDFDYY
jgi:ubiquinone/menaquinone biosynthesis C-methylase UbiE